jgi:hypothetical protein
LALAGCDSATNTLFPSLGGSSSYQGSGFYTGGDGPPQLGNTYFEPDGVTPGSPTGTFVGQKVQSFRAELSQLQENIRAENTQLQALRTKTIQDSNAYHENVASMRARLQVGTTPSNPVLMNRWEAAQGQLATINQDVVLMDQLAQMITVNQATATYMLDGIRGSFAIPGAVDEDHRQLRILEDETQQTSVLVDRLLNELTSDIRRQTAYVLAEKGNLGTLAVAIKNGQLFGSNTAPGGYSTSAAGGMGGYAQMASANPMAGSSPALMGAPLVVIRFDRPNVAFEQPLTGAVRSALARNPGAVFDVVVADSGATSAASRGAERVVSVLNRAGVSSDRIAVSTAGMTGADEVRVFAR